MNKLVIYWFLLVVCVGTTSSAHAGLEVIPLEKWSGVFAGKDAVFRFSINGDESFQGMLGWRFASVGMSLVRGERQIDVRPGQGEIIEIRLQVPKINEGLVMESSLNISLYRDGERDPAASFVKPVWIFSADPFSSKRQWLTSLNIHLFDPEQQTVKALNSAQVPFKEIHNIDAIPEMGAGLLIVGEGISLKDYRGLWEIILKLGASGKPVLCLAIKEGKILIPASRESVLFPLEKMMLRKKEVIKYFDKKFDANAWPPDGEVVISSVDLKGDREAVIGEIIKGSSAGWPWLEFGFSNPHGKLILCGFGIIEKWDSGPMPRYLFAQILDYIMGKKRPVLSEE